MITVDSPYLLLHLEKNELGVYKNIEILNKTSREILNSGYFNKLRICTRNEQIFKFVNVKEVGYNGLIKGWHPLIKGIQIKIKFDIIEDDKLKYEEIKELVRKKLNSKMFEAILGIEDFRKKIEMSKNINEIIHILEPIK